MIFSPLFLYRLGIEQDIYFKKRETFDWRHVCMPFSGKVIEHNQTTGFLKADPLQIDNKTILVTMLSARWLRNLALNEDRDIAL